jgi:hypothetical protein
MAFGMTAMTKLTCNGIIKFLYREKYEKLHAPICFRPPFPFRTVALYIPVILFGSAFGGNIEVAQNYKSVWTQPRQCPHHKLLSLDRVSSHNLLISCNNP